jgi:phage regulator Rha-like protein
MDISEIGGLIRVVRGQRIMLDTDLAALYGVSVKQLKRQVRRNIARFPMDFLFVLTRKEQAFLRCQIGALEQGRYSKYLSYAFTEQGVAMLSGALNSKRAIHVNIEIMRAFVGLRRALAANKDLAERMEKAEKQLETHGATLGEHAKDIGSVFEEIRRLTAAPEGPRRRIGF